MNCLQFDQLKDAYVAGTLDPHLSLAYAVHIADCVACRRSLAEARARRLRTQGIYASLASSEQPIVLPLSTPNAVVQTHRRTRSTGQLVGGTVGLVVLTLLLMLATTGVGARSLPPGERVSPPVSTGVPTLAATRTREATHPPAMTRTPEATRPPAMTRTPEATRPPKATRTPEATRPPALTRTPEATRPPKATRTPEATRPPAMTRTPEATRPPALTRTPEATRPPALTRTPEATHPPAATRTAQVTRSPEPTQRPSRLFGQTP